MKTMMNLTTSPEDLARFSSSQDLRRFYTSFGCHGLELLPLLGKDVQPLSQILTPDMIVGVHLNCFGDWMYQDRSFLLEHFRRDLDFARQFQAEYVVFHVTQVTDEESFTYRMRHTDREVVLAACHLINELLDGQSYSFFFLMENLWWAGLNLLDSSVTRLLLDGVNYEKKGLMLDTGHFLHTNHKLRTQREALAYLHAMLDDHEELIPYIRGIHLQQSLTGGYVERWLSQPPALETDPEKRFCQVFTHIFAIDKHEPFTDPEVKNLVLRIAPNYVTYEYITRDRAEHAQFLEKGTRALKQP
ncbi:MAG: TIM barrel protein [Lachnospiraceae bacterium]|nr:TIM barrel protein [Lachnospiraceae bacterium]MCI9133759.1 TIM barrel protein [Lachnospiraceae bacterium]